MTVTFKMGKLHTGRVDNTGYNTNYLLFIPFQTVTVNHTNEVEKIVKAQILPRNLCDFYMCTVHLEDLSVLKVSLPVL